jgi:hypothetical protein
VGGGGPLELPKPAEVTVLRPSPDCDREGDGEWSEDENESRGEIANQSGDERLLEVSDEPTGEGTGGPPTVTAHVTLLRAPQQEEGTNPRGDDAALGDGESVEVEFSAYVVCDGAAWPEPGRYRQEVSIVSTDTLGGDSVEQFLEVTVIVE